MWGRGFEDGTFRQLDEASEDVPGDAAEPFPCSGKQKGCGEQGGGEGVEPAHPVGGAQAEPGCKGDQLMA